jgi:integrase
MHTLTAALGRKPFTMPIINKGKEIKSVPKGSTKVKEQAKQAWYVDYSYFDQCTESMKRLRVTNEGNRIKDPELKAQHFNNLRDAYHELLEGGWNPFDERSNDKLKKSIVSLSLAEAKLKFDEYHHAKGTRKKSIQTYHSKINMFIEHHGSDVKVNVVEDYDITNFLNHHERIKKWSGVTYNLARISLNNFFRFLKTNKYIPINPVTDIESRKKMPTEMHQVFTDADFDTVLAWLRENDPYMLLFVKMIYYTCIRPKELRQLQLRHIDLLNNTITVPASIAKNKKGLPVSIDATLRLELDKLNLDGYPKEYHLLGSTNNIVGMKAVGENTPYNRFQLCLDKTKLLNRNYTLYSIKHLSNVKKFLAGWSIAEICAANRHSSLVETETYLRDLLKFVPTTKAIPPI